MDCIHTKLTLPSFLVETINHLSMYIANLKRLLTPQSPCIHKILSLINSFQNKNLIKLHHELINQKINQLCTEYNENKPK